MRKAVSFSYGLDKLDHLDKLDYLGHLAQHENLTLVKVKNSLALNPAPIWYFLSAVICLCTAQQPWTSTSFLAMPTKP
jgi:hypothetical protein